MTITIINFTKRQRTYFMFHCTYTVIWNELKWVKEWVKELVAKGNWKYMPPNEKLKELDDRFWRHLQSWDSFIRNCARKLEKANFVTFFGSCFWFKFTVYNVAKYVHVTQFSTLFVMLSTQSAQVRVTVTLTMISSALMHFSAQSNKKQPMRSENWTEDKGTCIKRQEINEEARGSNSSACVYFFVEIWLQ